MYKSVLHCLYKIDNRDGTRDEWYGKMEIQTEASKKVLKEDIEELMKRKDLSRQTFGVSSHSQRNSFSRNSELVATNAGQLGTLRFNPKICRAHNISWCLVTCSKTRNIFKSRYLYRNRYSHSFIA